MFERSYEIIKALRRMDKPDMAYGYDGAYKWNAERIGPDAANLIESMKSELEQLQELAKAKAEGRLVVLPCMVGTRVWVIGQNCDMCRDMYAEEPCLFGDCEYKGVFESIFSIGMTDKFGKTVFLTREEAERAFGKV